MNGLDRKKVKKGLEQMLSDYEIMERIEPNQKKHTLLYHKAIVEDAIALLKEDCHNCKLECLLQRYDQLKEKYDKLLKEQEDVEPKQVGLYGKEDWYGLVCVCPDCKAEWMSDEADTHFCPKCGQAVKWE